MKNGLSEILSPERIKNLEIEAKLIVERIEKGEKRPLRRAEKKLLRYLVFEDARRREIRIREFREIRKEKEG